MSDDIGQEIDESLVDSVGLKRDALLSIADTACNALDVTVDYMSPANAVAAAQMVSDAFKRIRRDIGCVEQDKDDRPNVGANANGGRAIYIAGPMSHAWKNGYEDFFRAEQMWKSRPYSFGVVINPWDFIIAEGDRLVDLDGCLVEPIAYVRYFEAIEKNPDALKRVLDREESALRLCSAIYLLRGWEQFEGSRRELAIALERGMEIILEGDRK